MNDVEEIVAENATFNRPCCLVDPSIYEAGDKGKGEMAKVMDKSEVEKGKEKRDSDHAKGSRPFGIEIFV